MNTEPIQVTASSTPPPEGEGKVAKKKADGKRRGVVLIAVLIVVASLSLAGYHYSDMMTSESKASEYAHRSVQARAFAESGIHYAAAMLSDPDSYANTLGGNPWNNPDKFKNQVVQGDPKLKGYFSIIAPDPNDPASVAYGVTDESGKINLNALMKLDAADFRNGDLVHDVLMKLPRMTPDIADAIVDWLDADNDPRPNGAENEYYQQLNPPYRCKNGPIDSIDELLLVKGVTRDLLYGTDFNRNGAQDLPSEASSDTFSRGWSAYLTIHSREQNSNVKGFPYVYLNDPDLTKLYPALTAAGISDDMAKFIVLYRLYPHDVPTNPAPVTGNLASRQLNLLKPTYYNINSIFDLVNTQAKIQSVVGNKLVNTLYYSPLKDDATLRDQLPKLFAVATLTDPAASTEIPARINVNTAPKDVLTALKGAVTDLTDNDVEKIDAARKSGIDMSSPAWLRTEAQISLTTLRKLDKYITTRAQVYRIQSVGYFSDKGPAVRLEAVIDTNSGRPRILAWRDLSELGRGWTDTPMP